MADVYLPAFAAETEWRGSDVATLNPVRFALSSEDHDLDEAMALACIDDDHFALHISPCQRIGDYFASAGLPWRPMLGVSAPPACRAVPFAVTPNSINLSRKLGLTLAVPTLEVAREVNSKVWSAIAREKAGAPLGSVALTSSEVSAKGTVLLQHGPIILKEAFGVSGAGNVLVASKGRLEAVVRVLRKEEECGRRVELVIEPFLAKRADFSSHFKLAADGRLEFIGFQSLLNNGSRYLGSRSLSAPELVLLQTTSLMDTLSALAAQLTEAGYFGPVCVDGLIRADDSLVPVIEVNARMSMGLLNLLLSSKVLKWGLATTLIKIRVRLRNEATPILDLLAGQGLLPKKPGQHAVLPVTSNISTATFEPLEMVVALLYRTEREEALLWNTL